MSAAEVAPLPERQRPRTERRRERRPVRLGAYGVLEDGQTVEVAVLDLSYEGCAIACQFELTPGERIKLYVLRRGAIAATVHWAKDGKAGLVFDASTEPVRQHWPRRCERVTIDAEMAMRRLGQANFTVRVADLSPDGCKVELIDRPGVDEPVLIRFKGLEVMPAEVCWVDGAWAGLRFEKRMHPAVFELLLERLGG
jgi:hypothetical protein